MKTFSNYSQARNEFKNGSVVFFSGGKKNLVRRAITWATGGPNYHVGIAFWADVGFGENRLLLAESQPDGYRIVNLSSYAERTMTTFDCPVSWSVIASDVIGSAGAVPYDFLDLAVIGAHERFGTPIPSGMTGIGEVCSVMTSKVLQSGGLIGIETMVSPQRLFEQLSKIVTPSFVAS